MLLLDAVPNTDEKQACAAHEVARLGIRCVRIHPDMEDSSSTAPHPFAESYTEEWFESDFAAKPGGKVK
jgi:hypothetical protein